MTTVNRYDPIENLIPQTRKTKQKKSLGLCKQGFINEGKEHGQQSPREK
jgi:hypothetical protein